MPMKQLMLAIGLLSAPGALDARADVWQPSPGHRQVPIWPGAVPDAAPLAGPEFSAPVNKLVAGKPWLSVQRVTQPTMTVYPPHGANTGAAVIVFPGGGYMTLAIDLEGTEVCEWLASRGITAVLLKYRVPASGPHWDADCQCRMDAKAPMALQDAQRTVGLVRAHAAEWHVDPHRIGVLGFSAGGHLVADVSTHGSRRSYRAVDAADTLSCRPDFAVALYPGHMLEKTTRDFELNPTLPVSGDTPPTFLLQAVDDPVDPVENSLVYYLALKKAGVPVELHLYAHGGHAFGLRGTAAAITRWPELMETWLGTIGMVR
jgi:acetyl esterase/lipase